jgi:uncharacterized membrane-anchored protein
MKIDSNDDFDHKVVSKFHPLREALYDELHVRPSHAVTTPHKISHLAFRISKDNHNHALRLICELCQQHGIAEPTEETMSFKADFEGYSIQWESHVEFYSITIMKPCQSGDDLFEKPAIDSLPGGWLTRLQGEIVVAFHLGITEKTNQSSDDDLRAYFDGYPVAISEAMDGKVKLYTAFRLHGDGYGRFIVSNEGISKSQIGRLARRLIEMETYRLFAMLAFPLAKQIAPQLLKLDQQLADLLSELTGANTVDEERTIMDELAKLEARLETWRAITNRRFSGAKAYHEMIQSRLNRIAENKVAGNETLSEYMCRRLDPALRTCSTVHASMEDLSRRISHASELLRTRVHLGLQEQNRILLSTMNRRARLQFRLQETVEGLSVVAISYYLVSLIKIVLGGMPVNFLGLSKSALLAAIVPLVFGVVFWLIRRLKHSLIVQPVKESSSE